MTELFVSALITFFVAIDPPGCAAIYASMTTDASPRQRRAMAFRAIFVATIILLIFGFFGEALLHAMGVSLDSFRIAGGIMLFIIAIEMVFEKRTERREGRAQEIIDTPEIAGCVDFSDGYADDRWPGLDRSADAVHWPQRWLERAAGCACGHGCHPVGHAGYQCWQPAR